MPLYAWKRKEVFLISHYLVTRLIRVGKGEGIAERSPTPRASRQQVYGVGKRPTYQRAEVSPLTGYH